MHKSSDSDALTFNIDSSKPRFLITSEPDPASPPNAPRFSHQKSSEKDLQESTISDFHLVIETSTGRKSSFSNLILPGETTTEKLQLEERPRKLSSGLKAFLAKEASEKMTLSPVHEDDENAESPSTERERCS
ncbi:unnamed protein product [Wuchereria bancrofti]|uniref:Uncharacterized protein n=1 Tax=Wuchereria bancrofti TaxID=6293 RepID=A0A3P7DYY1_WUCBA|nr:unnamed protein product [Wuchereria bancrofti]